MDTAAKIQAVIREKIPEGLIVPCHDDSGHRYAYSPTGEIFRSVTTKTGIIEVGSRLKDWAANCAVEYIDRNWHNITPENRTAHFLAAALEHKDRLTDAGDVGTRGHAVIESYLKDWIATGRRPADICAYIEKAEVDPRLWAIARSAEQAFIDFGILPVASELRICSLKYKFAGTLDFLAMMPKIVREGRKELMTKNLLDENVSSCTHEWGPCSNPKFERCFNCDAKRKWVFTLVDFKSSNSIKEKPSYIMQTSAYRHGFYELTGIKTEELIIIRLDKYQKKYEAIRVLNPAKAFRTFLHVSKVYDYLFDDIEAREEPMYTKEEISIF